MQHDVCYENSFLKEVIVRVDFASEVDHLIAKIPTGLANAAVRHFPIVEPQAAMDQELEFTGEKIIRKKRPFTLWNYYGREREKRLAISRSSIFASVTRYGRFDDMKTEFLSVLEAFQRTFPEVRASRTGLRYINRIELELADVYDWREYIQPGLLGVLSHFPPRGSLTRAFNIVEMKYGEIDLKFQFGMTNPDYPAPIRRPFFVLDLDGYARGLQDFPEVVRNIDSAHDHIQELFEDSITERLREVMHG